MRLPQLLKKRGAKLVFGFLLGLILFSGFFGVKKVTAAFNSADAVINPELTAAAQGAKRASDFLSWSIGFAGPSSGTFSATTAGTTKTSIKDTLRDKLWKPVFQLVLIIYVAIVIVLAFGFMTKADWLEKWKRYIPWLIISLIASAFSFIIAVFIINLFDQAVVSLALSSTDKLINIGYEYSLQKGLESSPAITDIEGVNNTIFLLKALSYTSYAIGGVMVLRTIILWMMIIVLPLIFPFIAFPITQSLGKVWLREFIRWLFYGLLVALFLYASNQIFTTITGNTTLPSTNYGEATNISLTLPDALGGAGAGTSGSTKVESSATYSKFIASLIMLWVSIILPWFLMRFAINITSSATRQWYERNRTSPRLQQFIRTFTPPGREVERKITKTEAYQPPLRTITDREKESVIAPAAPVEREEATPQPSVIGEPTLPENIAKAPPASSVETINHEEASTIKAFQQMPPQKALNAAGYLEVGSIAERIDGSIKKNEKLTELARLEQEPDRLARISGDIHDLRNPETIPNVTKRQQAQDFKNSVLMSGASTQTRGIASLIRNDTTPLANQSITRELNEKNIETVKENTKNLLDSKKITNEVTTRQLQGLETAINSYQSTPPSKPGERHILASGIEKAINNIRGTREGREGPPIDKARETTPGIAMKTLPASELAQSEEGKELLDSMDILNATEVATVSSGGVEDLISQSKDINKSIADKKTNDDYEKTKAQWVEYYKKTPVPTTETIKNRSDWITNQIHEQEELLNQISGGDFEKRKKALERLEKIMPFLMLGHYSLLDVTIYLKAKIAAANQVLNEIKTDQNQPSQTNPTEKIPDAYPPAPPPAQASPQNNFSVPSQSTPEDIIRS